ncbi:MAG: hypothetical protein RL216_2692, partial [Pseudomonadota bacterium]
MVKIKTVAVVAAALVVGAGASNAGG